MLASCVILVQLIFVMHDSQVIYRKILLPNHESLNLDIVLQWFCFIINLVITQKRCLQGKCKQYRSSQIRQR